MKPTRLAPVLVVLLGSSVAAQGRWVRTGTLTPAEGYVATGRHFGWTVALAGDEALVAAPPLEGGTAPGQALFYGWWGPTWSLRHTFEVPGGVPSDDFGRALALGADVALIGAPGEGAAYLYTRQHGEWSLALRVASGGHAGDVLALAGDQGFIGLSDRDEVQVVEHANGVWRVAAVLTDGDAEATRFGKALAADGSTLVVGAPEADAVFVFTRQVAGWQLEARLDGVENASDFGAALALAGDRLVVGAPHDGLEGQAYLYERSGGAWGLVQAFDPGIVLEQHEFGATVSIRRDAVAIGAPGEYGDLGALYVFEPGVAGWTRTGRFEAEPQSGPARFAYHVGTDGAHLLGNIGLNDAGVISLYVGALYVYSFQPELHDAGWTPSPLPGVAGVRHVDIDAGAVYAGRPFVVLASARGTTPPVPWAGLEIPLAQDPLLTFTMGGGRGGLAGHLDAEGRASATLRVPTMAGIRQLHVATVVLCPETGIPEVVSPPLTVEIGH
jgi:hypothetical protein